MEGLKSGARASRSGKPRPPTDEPGWVRRESRRICRHAALMFAILLGLPLLPLTQHRWILLVGILPLSWLFRSVLSSVLLLWRGGAWRSVERSDARLPWAGGEAGLDLQIERPATPVRPRRDDIEFLDEDFGDGDARIDRGGHGTSEVAPSGAECGSTTPEEWRARR